MMYNDDYWDRRFEFSSKEIPEEVKNAIKRVYNSYPSECMPQGICDPMYIMNTICKELGVGNGRGEFYLNRREYRENMPEYPHRIVKRR